MSCESAGFSFTACTQPRLSHHFSGMPQAEWQEAIQVLHDEGCTICRKSTIKLAQVALLAFLTLSVTRSTSPLGTSPGYSIVSSPTSYTLCSGMGSCLSPAVSTPAPSLLTPVPPRLSENYRALKHEITALRGREGRGEWQV